MEAIKIIDLTDYSMEDWEGVQFFEQKRARDFILNRKLKKRAYIEKKKAIEVIKR